IVNDQQTNQFIWWTTKGKSIWIPDAAAFSKSVLPRHFKHSNWQSFVRQLNLYGFRKVCDSEGLDQTRTNAQDGWQFRHEQFQRNCPHLLQNIKRK
ncbi:HSF-type DNA-binding-domain-containing protein, partial [Dichotomocladium elegans]